ncbi:zinc finger MYM-type protein 1-like, partial [Aphis craccivora]
LHVESTIDVEKSVKKFISVYKDDVDDSIKYEIVHFKQFWDQLKPTFDGSDVLKIFEWMTECNVINIFPNIHIALRIYLTIPVANCTAERAFSKLTKIKNKNRSSQTQDNLSSLMILSTENDVLQNLSFDKTLEIFATQKARKKTFT